MRQAVIDVGDDGDTAGPGAAFMTALVTAGLAGFEVLSCDGERVVMRVTVGDTLDEDRVAGLPSVTGLECVDRSDAEATYVVDYDISDVPNGAVVDESAVAPSMLTVDLDGASENGVCFELTGPQDLIGQVIADLEAAGADVSLRTLRDYDGPRDPLDGLTERQRTVLEAAYRLGYFELPREISLEAVADDLDLDRSTVSEHLQRAERNLLAALLRE